MNQEINCVKAEAKVSIPKFRRVPVLFCSLPVPFIAIEKTQSISFWPTFPVFIVSKISKMFFITQSASYLIIIV